MRKWSASLIGAFIILLASVSQVMAGGGGIFALYDPLPEKIVAGQPITIRFRAFAPCTNGLVSGLQPQLIVGNSRTRTLRVLSAWTVAAQPEDEDGYYAATVTFPSAGEWTWQAEGFVNTTPERAVVLAAPTPPSADTGHGALDWLIASGVGMIIGSIMLSTWLRVQRRKEAELLANPG